MQKVIALVWVVFVIVEDVVVSRPRRPAEVAAALPAKVLAFWPTARY